MKWLFDSNVLSEHVRVRPDRAVLGWLAARPRDRTAISLLTVAELRVGAMGCWQPKRQAELIRWIEDEIAPMFAGRILQVSSQILIEWLQLLRRTAARGRTRAPADLLIAATARVHDLILVTRNVRDFAETGIVVYDPWTGETHKMEQP